MTSRLRFEGNGLSRLSGRGGHRRLPALGVFVCTLSWLMFFAAQAPAQFTHPLTGSFGPEGLLSSATFSNVQGIAVDQSSGDVYVYDTGAAGGSIYRFNAAGEPVSFSALGANAITGVGGQLDDENEIAIDSSTGPAAGDIYVANATTSVFTAPTGPRSKSAEFRPT